MRRLLDQRLPHSVPLQVGLLWVGRPKSTSATSRKKPRSPKSSSKVSTKADAAAAASQTFEKKEANASGPVPHKDNAAPTASLPTSRTTSAAPSWVETTLHYDAEKVQKLANLFTGAQPFEGVAPALNADKAKAKRRSAKSLGTVEEQLRQPAPEASTDKHAASKLQPKKILKVPEGVDRNFSSGSQDKTAPYEGSKEKESAMISNWTAALLACKDISTAKAVKELVSLQTEVLQADSQASSAGLSVSEQTTVDEHEVLSALLQASRLRWHLESAKGNALHFASLQGEEPLSNVQSAHLLCVTASALESSLKSFRRVRNAFLKEDEPRASLSATAKKRATWHRECAARYETLFYEVTTLLTAQLDLHNTLHTSMKAEPIRLEVLLSALLSLLHALSILEGKTASLQRSTAHSNISAESPTTDQQRQQEMLENLCVQTGSIIASWNFGSPGSAGSDCLEKGGDSLFQSYLACASLFERQVKNLQQQTSASPNVVVVDALYQGVVSNLFLYCVAVLRAAVATEVAIALAAETSGSTDAREKYSYGSEVGVVLRNGGKAAMAQHVETFIMLLHPHVAQSAAALATQQHRTSTPALSVMLTNLLDYAGRVQAVRLTQSRARANTPQASQDQQQQEHKPVVCKPRSAHAALYSSASTMLVSPASVFWEHQPAHLALLLRTYYDLFAAMRQWLPRVLAKSVGSEHMSMNSRWVVPFHARVVRVGMTLQMDSTLLAAAHLGVAASVPRAPGTPLEKVAATRLRRARGAQHLMAKVFSEEAEIETVGHATETTFATRQEKKDVEASSTLAAVEAKWKPAQWRQVMRLAGGLRVECCESLYRAVLDLTAHCTGDTVAQQRLQSAATKSTPSALEKSSPALMLIRSVSRLLFCIPRTEYLLGLYSDDLLTTDAAVEQSRRVFTACSGVFLWLRELSEPFDTFVTSTSQQHPSKTRKDKEGGEQNAPEFLLGGTTKSNARDAVFFMTYLLHHWPALRQTSFQQPQQLAEPTGDTAGGIEGGRQVSASPLMRVLEADGVPTALPPTPVDHFITPAHVEAYLAETLFHLQHGTAKLLQHYRTRNRFFHFTGEVRGKTGLMAEEALLRRHVSSTLSVVYAYRQTPNFVWMPLAEAQELLFELDAFPQLMTVRATDTPSDGIDLFGSHHPLTGQTTREMERSPTSSTSSYGKAREYPQVRVGNITCNFARAHGYLVQRLAVLSGVLREFRSQLLDTSAQRSGSGGMERALGEAVAPEPSNLHCHSAVLAARSLKPNSFEALLLANAAHSPKVEVHRQSNYSWAHPLATMLREDMPRLPAKMEGTPKWTEGVLRTLERMELVMQETHRQNLFINVVKGHQAYWELRRTQGALKEFAAESQRNEEHLDANGDGDGGDNSHLFSSAADVNLGAVSRESGRAVWQVRVVRPSPSSPLGVALSGDGCVLRVQATVSVPAEGSSAAAAHVDGDGSVEELPSPFAEALATCPEGRIVPDSVIGAHVTAVDGVTVKGGREVAVQVKGKVSFVLTLQT